MSLDTVEASLAERALSEIEGLFKQAHAGPSRAYFTLPHTGLERYTYVAISCGLVRTDELAQPAPSHGTPEEAYEAMISAVKAIWPDHAELHVMWRIEPEFRRIGEASDEAKALAREWGINPPLAGWRSYCRLTAIRV